MRRSWVIAACAAGLLAPESAAAGGGPVSPVQGGAGVSTTGGHSNYVALGAHRGTVIQRVRRDGGVVERSRYLSGHYGVPGAAYDGSTTGLSADGRTLVLAGFTIERSGDEASGRGRGTRLLVLDTDKLVVRKRISLPEYLSVDAISPDGRTLYVLRYPKARAGGLIYDVLAMNLRTGRLNQEPIMDPREPDEQMGGIPLARAMSPDGRWAYTLYSGEENFVHALDTLKGEARCIDLPGGDFSAERLTVDGPALHVGDAATIDLHTFALAQVTPTPTPTPTRRAAATPARATPDDGGIAWWPVPLGLVALGAFVLLRARRSKPLELTS